MLRGLARGGVRPMVGFFVSHTMFILQSWEKNGENMDPICVQIFPWINFSPTPLPGYTLHAFYTSSSPTTSLGSGCPAKKTLCRGQEHLRFADKRPGDGRGRARKKNTGKRPSKHRISNQKKLSSNQWGERCMLTMHRQQGETQNTIVGCQRQHTLDRSHWFLNLRQEQIIYNRGEDGICFRTPEESGWSTHSGLGFEGHYPITFGVLTRENPHLIHWEDVKMGELGASIIFTLQTRGRRKRGAGPWTKAPPPFHPAPLCFQRVFNLPIDPKQIEKYAEWCDYENFLWKYSQAELFWERKHWGLGWGWTSSSTIEEWGVAYNRNYRSWTFFKSPRWERDFCWDNGMRFLIGNHRGEPEGGLVQGGGGWWLVNRLLLP